MKANRIVAHIVRNSDMSIRAINREMGRAPGNLSHILNGERLPRVDTLASAANVCGWDLMVRNRESGEEIIIEPEK